MKRYGVFIGFILMAASALAQEPPPPPAAPAPPAQPAAQPPAAPGLAPRPAEVKRNRLMPAIPEPSRPPMERALGGGPRGRWWSNPEMVQKLGLSADQQKRMDDIFQQNRLRLIDLNASLQKEEVILEPLMQADQPDEARVVAQIDKVAQARAELEKANARFLLGIRRVLTPDQWKKLQEEGPRAQRIPSPARR